MFPSRVNPVLLGLIAVSLLSVAYAVTEEAEAGYVDPMAALGVNIAELYVRAQEATSRKYIGAALAIQYAHNRDIIAYSFMQIHALQMHAHYREMAQHAKDSSTTHSSDSPSIKLTGSTELDDLKRGIFLELGSNHGNRHHKSHVHDFEAIAKKAP